MNEESIPDLVKLLRMERGKRENPFAFVRHYLRTDLRIDHFSFLDDRPAVDDLMQVEFGLVPDEVGELTPAAMGVLFKFRHRLRNAPSEVARKVVLAEIQSIRSELVSNTNPDPVATIAIKALGVLLGISTELAVGDATTPIQRESERRIVSTLRDRLELILAFFDKDNPGPLRGKTIAKLSRLNYDSHFRADLSELKSLGFLKHNGQGYTRTDKPYPMS